MNNDSSRRHLIGTIRGVASNPRPAAVLMIIMIATIFVAEFTEVFSFAFIKPFPKLAIVVSHLFLLAVFSHYLNVYLKYRAQSERLSELNAQLLAEITEHKRIEDARNESEEKFRAIFNSSHDGILLADTESRKFLLGNERICRMLGYTLEELQELGIEDIHPHEDLPHIAEQFIKLVNGDISLVEGARVKRKDNGIIYVDIGASNVSIQGRRYSLGMFRDVSVRKRTESALADSEARLRAFGNAIPDIAFILDEHGRYTEILAQPQMEGLLYTDMKTMKGRLLHEVLPGKDADLFLGVIRRTLETQENQTIEYAFEVQDGRRWFEGRTAPLQITGQDRMVVWVSRDITAQKEAEEKLRRNEASLAEAQRIAHLGNWEWDIARGELRWSDEIYRIFGLAPQEFGATYEAFLNSVHPDDRESVKAAVNKALAEHASYSLDHRVVLPDGTVRIVHEQAEVTIGDQGEPSRMTGTVQDITEHKRLEEELEKQNQELEGKVLERTEELEEKTIEAEAANLAKSEFLANISHELKTPLNAIVGFSELLKIGAAGELTATQNEYVQEVWESGRHLNRIINSILSMVQLESHQAELELSEFPLKETIEEILDRFSEKAAREGIRTTIEIPDEIGRIVADQAKLQEVVKQLLANAIKFTPEGGAIAIRAQRVAEAALGGGRPERPNAYPALTPHHSGNFLEISVADTGIGIAEQDLGRLFKPFQQLDTPLTKTYEGIGLGLCICRKYVELHGGKIWVESEVGKGSTFYLAIPELARLPQP